MADVLNDHHTHIHSVMHGFGIQPTHILGDVTVNRSRHMRCSSKVDSGSIWTLTNGWSPDPTCSTAGSASSEHRLGYSTSFIKIEYMDNVVV